MFSSIAYAENTAGAAASATQGGGASFLVMMGLMIGIFYFILIRPQQKRQKELTATIKALKSGDKVVLTSGIFGTIDSVGENNTFYVNISNNVKIHVSQSAIAGKMSDMPTREKK